MIKTCDNRDQKIDEWNLRNMTLCLNSIYKSFCNLFKIELSRMKTMLKICLRNVQPRFFKQLSIIHQTYIVLAYHVVKFCKWLHYDGGLLKSLHLLLNGACSSYNYWYIYLLYTLILHTSQGYTFQRYVVPYIPLIIATDHCPGIYLPTIYSVHMEFNHYYNAFSQDFMTTADYGIIIIISKQK